MDLHRRRGIPRSTLRYRRGYAGTMGQHRVEVPLYGERLMAGLGSQPGGDWRDLQPDHGSVRKVRYDLQWRGPDSRTDVLAREVRRTGQRLGALSDRARDSRVRPIDH